MGVRRKLTEVEEFYVAHNPENLTLEEMAIYMRCNRNILPAMLNTAKPAGENVVAAEEKPIVKVSDKPKPYTETL